MNEMRTRQHLPCNETPDNCNFSLRCYQKGEIFINTDKGMNYIVFCQKGKVQLISSLFQKEILHSGEIMFLPRMADCQAEALEDTHVVIHTFNNTVCRPEHCILSYLYTHKRKKDEKKLIGYCCKLSVHEVIVTFMLSICHYLMDGTGDILLWHLKHKELIRLFSRYYKTEELHAFFHPMTGEEVPFKSLVLAHYMKANDTQELADLCGYGITTFRRMFKKEFDTTVYQWLIRKRAEHIKYRLSQTFIPLTEIIDEFNFSSPQHFNGFCKKYLGDTPGNLRKVAERSTKPNGC